MGIEFEQYQNAEIVTSAMLNSDSFAQRFNLGNALTFLFGSENIRLAVDSLAIALSGQGLELSLGGTGQAIFANGLYLSNCPAQTYAIPPNSGSDARLDLIAIQYLGEQTNPHDVQIVENGEPTDTTGYSVVDSVSYRYVQGYSPTAVPAAPAGYFAFATILVPPNALLGTNCSVNYLFPTLAQIVADFVGTFVSTLNGEGGPQTIIAGDANVIIGRNAQGQITIDVTGTEGPPGPKGDPGGQGVQGPPGNVGPEGPPATDSVGASFAAFQAFSSIAGGNTISVALPTLFGDSSATYVIEAYATGFDFQSSGGTATLVGNGASWGGQAKTGYTYSERSLFIAGTAQGGEAPSVSIEAVAPIGMRSGTTGFVHIRAVRTS